MLTLFIKPLTQRICLTAFIGIAASSFGQEQPVPHPAEIDTEPVPTTATTTPSHVSALKRLTTGKATAQLVTPVATPRVMKNYGTFNKAVNSKQDWWKAYQEKHQELPAATPYPYHAHMGLTEADYDALCAFSQSWVWTPTSDETVYLDQGTTGKIELSSQNFLEPWNGLTFDPSNGTISIRENTLTLQPENTRPIKLGPFSGFHVETWIWKDHEGIITENGSLMVAMIMSSPNVNHLYIHLQKMLIVGGGLASNESVLFRIPAVDPPKNP